MNTIYTIEEYMAQGFTREESELARKFDLMHNRYDELTDKELVKYYAIAKFLEL